MTHEEQIKWMSDRIARLDAQIESDMKNTVTLIGHLGTKRPWVGLTKEEYRKCTAGALDNYDLWAAIEAKLKDKNT